MEINWFHNSTLISDFNNLKRPPNSAILNKKDTHSTNIQYTDSSERNTMEINLLNHEIKQHTKHFKQNIHSGHSGATEIALGHNSTLISDLNSLKNREETSP
ncbi:hypothetical protein CEXT_734771 [Caerostris extrusa]|uniref:Uncharacterized protein n=1 Tax=Caerostris extrusa TaxID=172846 RepID=A0AAV4MKW7_CAEEX|nr:hypothetical protein CEXT_734771 [Caerostris extrusa]